MIHRLAVAGAAAHPERPFLLSREREVSFAAAAGAAERIAGAFSARGISRVGLHMPNSASLVLTLLGAARAGVETCVISHEYPHAEVGEILERLSLSTLLVHAPIGLANVTQILATDLETAGSAIGSDADDAGVLILTTGTTGKPKAARYAWSRLAAQVRSQPDRPDTRWLLAYNLNHFGGLQMLLHALANGSTLVLPESLSPVDAVSAIEQFQVTHLSATPTFWRLARAQVPRDRLRALPLKQITLGAEAAPSGLLEELRSWFPSARIVHIFAATEVGSCFSVQDGRDGVPASILDRGDDAPTQFRVEQGELFIRSRHGMLGYYGEESVSEDGWRSTGDLVEQRGDRLYFVGRTSERINVGGVKVDPLPVEERVQRVAAVTLARVYGKANAITGQVVAVDVVAAADADHRAVEKSIREACRDLPPQAHPRLIRFVDSLETRNAKLVRRSS